MREIAPDGTLSDIIRLDGGQPAYPRGAARGGTMGVVWMDKIGNVAEDVKFVFADTGPVVPPTPTVPPVPVGQMSIASTFTPVGGGLGSGARLSVTVTNTGGPASVLRLDVPGVGAREFPFTTNPLTVQVDVPSATECRPVTLTGTLQGPHGPSAPFSAGITVDSAVDALVVAANPNLSGTESAPSGPAAVNAVPDIAIPANAGAPGYTPINAFAFRIAGRSAECSLLKQYTLTFDGGPDGQPLPTAKTDAITRNTIDGLAYLSPPGSPAKSGTYRFHIDVMDNAGNVQRYPGPNQSYQIVLDYEAPEISAGTLTVTEEAGRDGMVDVSVSSLVVTDEGYINGSGQPDYWGYWIVVKRAGSAAPTSDEWLTRGTVVQASGSPFKWNLATGLADTFEPGAQYRLYLRFLDGAGNPSSAVISAPIQIDALEGPRLFLPVLSR
jgi:hypothetical protein